METPEKWDKYKDSSVFELLTRLCEKTTATYEVTEDFGSFNKNLVKKLRGRAFAVILKKSEVVLPDVPCEPSMELLTHYYINNSKKKKISDYDNLVSIKEKIDWVLDRDKSKDEQYFTEVLACVVSLRNSVPADHGKSMFESPFSFGKLDEILPSAIQLNKSDPVPYKQFPSHIFQLPFSIKDGYNNKSPVLYDIPTEAFVSKPGTNLSHLGKLSASNIHSVSSRSSRGTLLSLSTYQTYKTAEGFPLCPRLIAPRDLMIPQDENPNLQKTRKMTVQDDGIIYPSVQEIFHKELEEAIPSSKTSLVSLWDLACIETKIHTDLWEEASKMPAVDKRGLISLSISQMSHWKQTHMNRMSKMKIISEVQFILHIKYLMIGIQSSSFTYDKDCERFTMKSGLCLEGMLQSSLETYISDLLIIGTCYWKLNLLITPTALSGDIIREGFVYKSMCESIRQYLVWFRLEIDKIFGEELLEGKNAKKRIPALLEILHQLRPLGYQIKTMAKIYKVYEHDKEDTSLRGAGLMAYLYNEITHVTQSQVSAILYATLQATCRVYFRFIQRFIFEGEMEDYFNEFFIKKDLSNIDSYNRRYWDRGFVIRNNETVPEFLRGVAKHILLCGKSLRLLKLCNPDDPLCFLLSTEYPTMKCCLTFAEIENQQKLYDLYRTQCLYVCGDPVTFQSLLVQKEAEKKAFREMVTLKQTETMQKLIEERRRLSRIVTASKRRQFTELQAAAEKAMELKGLKKQQDLQEDIILRNMSIESDRLHGLRLEEDKKKVIAYYTEIGREVEKRQMKAEWKMKRLKLDPRRVQLLTSEKTNLCREKLEMEHKSLEEVNIKNQSSTISVVKSRSLLENVESMTDSLENIISSEYLDTVDNLNDEQAPALSIPPSESLNEDLNQVVSEELDTPFESANNIISCDNVTNDIEANVVESDIHISDVINKNTLSSLKVYKSLDDELSPSDILNSNSHLMSKTASVSEQDIHKKYIELKLEAKRNQEKVLSEEFGTLRTTNLKTTNQLNSPIDNKQMELNYDNNCNDANTNKRKILNSQCFGLEPEETIDQNRNQTPQFDTEASREALRNKQKILGHEFGLQLIDNAQANRMKQRGSLTLDLKSCLRVQKGDWSRKEPQEFQEQATIRPMSIDSTPDNFLMTPIDQFQARLDLETPSTFGIGANGLPSAGTLSPSSAQVPNNANHTAFTDDGFRFPNVIEEQSDEETVPDFGEPIEQDLKTPETDKSFNMHDVKSKIWNFTTDDLNFDDFRPFTISSTANHDFKSLDIFDELLSMNSPKGSPYSDLNKIISTAEMKPMADLFKSIYTNTEEDESILHRIDDVDFSTIATCLQRSVMIPLSYQMEMVNNATLKYFLVNLDLYDHLKSLRDYFFLMDGEFAKTICMNLFEKLNITESPRELLNFATLHSILDKSFGSSIGGSNKYAEHLSFIINDMPLSFHHSSPDVLECLTLSYTVTWPLNIILSQEALDRYAKVFQFLVKMRRISWALEQDAEVLKMSLKETFMVSRELLQSPQYHSVQLYRYTMSSLIRALHCYVLTTCLQSSWKEFEEDLVNARTLDDLYSVHVVYIKKVLFRCLLNKRSTPIMKMLNDIFAVVLRFHHLLNARCWHIAENDVNYTHPLFQQIHELYVTYEKLAKHLHKTATHLSNCGYQPHLVELLTMINMNGYYSTPSQKD